MKTSWAILLCKFKESDVEPFPVQYYQDLFTGSATGPLWNMPRFFRDASHGAIDLSGTKVFGWYKLNKTVNDYNVLGGAARNELVKWARAAATAKGVDLSPYFSVVVCTNLWQDIGASPGLTGVIAQGANTPTPQLLGHEMGHIYGVKHSRREGSDVDYNDPWDIMSAANCYSAKDSTFGLIGPLFNAANMRARAWLDESRVWKAAKSADTTITLRPLARRDLSGYLAAELPGGLLVEFRVPKAWDGGIPRAAVLLHRLTAGTSYLVPGNSSAFDLVAGDSWGALPPEPGPIVDPFHGTPGYERLDVISIDAAAEKAVIRIRAAAASGGREAPVAVDPMSLILSGDVYRRWIELKHPHVPKVAEVQAFLRALSVADRAQVTARAKRMGEYAEVFEKAVPRTPTMRAKKEPATRARRARSR